MVIQSLAESDVTFPRQPRLQTVFFTPRAFVTVGALSGNNSKLSDLTWLYDVNLTVKLSLQMTSPKVEQYDENKLSSDHTAAAHLLKKQESG